MSPPSRPVRADVPDDSGAIPFEQGLCGRGRPEPSLASSCAESPCGTGIANARLGDPCQWVVSSNSARSMLRKWPRSIPVLHQGADLATAHGVSHQRRPRPPTSSMLGRRTEPALSRYPHGLRHGTGSRPCNAVHVFLGPFDQKPDSSIKQQIPTLHVFADVGPASEPGDPRCIGSVPA